MRLLAPAIQADSEAAIVDSLLASWKKPYSLAKFVSTSDGYRKRVGEAQRAAGVTFVSNFGWAPQRYQSRARPTATEARRWGPILESVATEAESARDPKRRELAVHFLTNLGGEFPSRLVLGGMLADLAAEHYEWVAGGDRRNPDASTTAARTGLFCDRLRVLFTEGCILGLQDTYTGAVIEFLGKNTYS